MPLGPDRIRFDYFPQSISLVYISRRKGKQTEMSSMESEIDNAEGPINLKLGS